jgi:hypothetical protein
MFWGVCGDAEPDSARPLSLTVLGHQLGKLLNGPLAGDAEVREGDADDPCGQRRNAAVRPEVEAGGDGLLHVRACV